ncbi:MAG: T9SS type A sorting domain-containing protein [candidate division WOR-3 bacterium]
MLIAFVLSTVPDGMMVFWEYPGIIQTTRPSTPNGWVVDSSFVGRFPRGCPGDSVGITGGSNTHNHTRIYGSIEAGGSGIHGRGGGGTLAAPAYHTHSFWSTGTINASSHIPPYRNFVVIRKPQEDTGLPAGVVMMFTQEPPPGWTVILVDSFPRGSLTPWAKSGSTTHFHTFSGSTGDPTPMIFNSGSAVVSGCHTHNFTGSTATSDNLPPYVHVIFARNEAWIEDVPVGAIAMFDAPPSGSSEIGTWESFDTLNAGRRFPRGCTPANALTAGGSLFHAHGISSITVQPSGGGAWVDDLGGGGAKTPHTHSAYATSTDTAFAIPPYRYTTFWQKTGAKALVSDQKQEETTRWTAIGLGNAIKIKGPPGLSVRVYDATGKRLFACETEAEELLIRGMKAGVFLVQMEKGGTEVVRKVVIR